MRASAIAADSIFADQSKYLESQRALENAVQKFDELTQTLAAVTRLIERCRRALSDDGDSLIAIGGLVEFEFAIEEIDSELLQISGVAEGTALYHDLDPGKAIIRQGQLLDAALARDHLPPVFLTLSEEEQHAVANALLKNLARQMNPDDPALGRYEVISLIDAQDSLTARFGRTLIESVNSALSSAVPRHIASAKATVMHQL